MFTIFFADLTIDKSSDNSNQNNHYHDIYNLTILHDQFSIFFQIFSNEGEKRVPKSRTDHCIDDKFGQIHFSHSCRERNKMPDNWDKSTDKNSNTSSFLEKIFRRLQFFYIQ